MLTRDGHCVTEVIHGRHDPVIVARAAIVVEAMAALTLADHLLLNLSSKIETVKKIYGKGLNPSAHLTKILFCVTLTLIVPQNMDAYLRSECRNRYYTEKTGGLDMDGQEKYVAYVGTYTHGSSIGIHVYDIDIEAGIMTEREVIPVNNASHMTKSYNGKYLYSIADEGVEVLAISPDGSLEPINKVGIDGMRGCYLSTDKSGKFLFVGGYHDGKVTVVHTHRDGRARLNHGRCLPQGTRQCRRAELPSACELRHPDSGRQISVRSR